MSVLGDTPGTQGKNSGDGSGVEKERSQEAYHMWGKCEGTDFNLLAKVASEDPVAMHGIKVKK